MNNDLRELSVCKNLHAIDTTARTHLRLVDVLDAVFIYNLRQDPQIGRHLNKPAKSVEDQTRWIEDYKAREALGKDFYFIIVNERQRRGLIRIYDIQDSNGHNSFSWGSWIIPPPPVPGLATYSAISIYEIGFHGFNFNRSHFDVRKRNSKVISFHLSTGATITNEDGENIYFQFDRANFAEFAARKSEAIAFHRTPL